MPKADFEAPLTPQKLLNLIKRVRESTTFALEGLVDKEHERCPVMVYQRLARVIRVVRKQKRRAGPRTHIICALGWCLLSTGVA